MTVMAKRNQVPIYLTGILIEFTQRQPRMLLYILNMMNRVRFPVEPSLRAMLAFMFIFIQHFFPQVQPQARRLELV